MRLSADKIKAIECLYEEAKLYAKLYFETDDEYKKKKYVSHFRSPIFDETNIKIFHKPIFSKKAYECFKQYGTKAFTDTKTVPKECLLTKEHPNGRTKSAKILFDKIVNKEINTFDDFFDFLLEYCYTITILRTENHKVKNNLSESNFLEVYDSLGIVICDKNGVEIKNPNVMVI